MPLHWFESDRRLSIDNRRELASVFAWEKSEGFSQTVAEIVAGLLILLLLEFGNLPRPHSSETERVSLALQTLGLSDTTHKYERVTMLNSLRIVVSDSNPTQGVVSPTHSGSRFTKRLERR